MAPKQHMHSGGKTLMCNPFICCTLCCKNCKYWHGCAITFAAEMFLSLLDLFLWLKPIGFDRFGPRPRVDTMKWDLVMTLCIGSAIFALLAGAMGILAAVKQNRVLSLIYFCSKVLMTLLLYGLMIFGILVLQEMKTTTKKGGISKAKKKILISRMSFYYLIYLVLVSYSNMCAYGLFRYCSASPALKLFIDKEVGVQALVACDVLEGMDPDPSGSKMTQVMEGSVGTEGETTANHGEHVPEAAQAHELHSIAGGGETPKRKNNAKD